MKAFKSFLLCIFTIWVFPISGKPLVPETKILNSQPPRVIRVCCSLGSNLGMFGIPFVKINQITSIEKIGRHHYLGNREEGDGILYTRSGGFIDMAHLRDQADWTAYLYSFIRICKEKGIVEQSFGHEGGEKTLGLSLPQNIDSLDELVLAGRIAYDLSIWHEIATGFGESSVPVVSEKFSSFSIEDAYSNLLGVTLGMKAIESDLPFEEAMTQLISKTLDSLGVVKTEADTYAALEDVRNIWWTRDARLPSNKITLKRLTNVYPCILPLLVPGWANDYKPIIELTVPDKTTKGQPLAELYQLKIRLNHKFPKNIKREITQADFNMLIDEVVKALKN
jgi:hypothetical protein